MSNNSDVQDANPFKTWMLGLVNIMFLVDLWCPLFSDISNHLSMLVWLVNVDHGHFEILIVFVAFI